MENSVPIIYSIQYNNTPPIRVSITTLINWTKIKSKPFSTWLWRDYHIEIHNINRPSSCSRGGGGIQTVVLSCCVQTVELSCCVCARIWSAGRPQHHLDEKNNRPLRLDERGKGKSKQQQELERRPNLYLTRPNWITICSSAASGLDGWMYQNH